MPGLAGVVVIDVVEGTALASLPYMGTVLAGRPQRFASLAEAVDWALSTGGWVVGGWAGGRAGGWLDGDGLLPFLVCSFFHLRRLCCCVSSCLPLLAGCLCCSARAWLPLAA